MSSRGSNYTRGNRQGKSVGNFPAWESRPRRGMPSLQFGASELTFIGAIELTRVGATGLPLRGMPLALDNPST